MRRILLGLMGLFLVCGVCFADGNPTAIMEYEYTIKNDSPIGITTIIPTTSIRPGVDKITAYEVLPYSSSTATLPYPWTAKSEVVIGLFDATDVVLTANTTEKIGEKEANNSASPSSAGERFERPKKVANGVVTTQGAFTSATIFFIRE